MATNAIVGAFVGTAGDTNKNWSASGTIATKMKDDEEDRYVKPKDGRWFN
jgi:hypothetical protein